MKRLLLALGLSFALLSPANAVVSATRVGDAAYTILPNDVTIYTTTVFTAGRTWTLPQAASSCIGQNCIPAASSLQILDLAGALTFTNTLTIAPVSGDTINGNAANLILSAAGVRVVLIPTSPTNWRAIVYGDSRAIAVATASPISLTTTTAANVTSLALSQGVWDCSGVITRKLAATTSVTQLKTSIFTTSATSGSLDTGTMVQLSVAANVMAADTSQVIGPIRVSPAATTTYYLVAQDTFTADTNAGYGQLLCRRAPA